MPRPAASPLPIDAVLPEVSRALTQGVCAVLQAPPGAGKTTRAPLALMDVDWAADGRIVMLEPRRVAARAAAERMASELCEQTGETVGYRIRGESRVGPHTRVEVVTEGVLTRRLQNDPELSGVAAVIFDEFHERSLHADLGLALCLESQAVLRPDLRLLVMSATLDGDSVAALMHDAPIITSQGRTFPVETRWLDAPWSRPGPQNSRRGPRFEDAMADLIRRALGEEPGDVLAFLPGVGEINRTASALSGLAGHIDVIPLHGALPFAKQRAALQPPARGRRKVVLATAIAETSLTIDGVRIVIDGGRARRARFDSGSGMTRLITDRVSRAGADQRRGRAGRTEPGVCYRLWTKGEEGGFAPFAPAEIAEADLAPLALELAAWGVSDPNELRWLDVPPPKAYGQARDILRDVGALDGRGGITSYGRRLAETPTHPRLAHMLAQSDEDVSAAAALAAILEDRDPLRGAPVDATLRLELLRDPKKFAETRPHAFDRNIVERLRAGAKDLARRIGARFHPGDIRPAAAARLLACAYPDRIGARRKGDSPRYLLSGGKGAVLPDGDSSGGAPLIVAADLDGDAREAKTRLAAAITRTDLSELYADRLQWIESCAWSRRHGDVQARRQLRFGAAILEDQPWKAAPPEALAGAMVDAVRDLGLGALPWTPAARRFQARVKWARAGGADLPDLSDEALNATLEDWLQPHLSGMRRRDHLEGLAMTEILSNLLDWAQTQALNTAAPAHFVTPLGGKAPIDYGGAQPSAGVRLQMLFGLTEHPRVAGLPLLLELLSPAGRPVQLTSDLPGFWASSYADVRRDMRGQYPKHSWPEDPAAAEPVSRAKRRPRP